MSQQLGLDCKIYRNTATYASPTWDEIPNVRDVTLNVESSEADVTTRGNAGWEAVIQGLMKASIEFEMVWDAADQDFIAIRAAYFARTAIEFLVLDGDKATSDNQGLRATCAIMNFNRSEPIDGPATVSVTIKPTYAANPPEWYIVP